MGFSPLFYENIIWADFKWSTGLSNLLNIKLGLFLKSSGFFCQYYVGLNFKGLRPIF